MKITVDSLANRVFHAYSNLPEGVDEETVAKEKTKIRTMAYSVLTLAALSGNCTVEDFSRGPGKPIKVYDFDTEDFSDVMGAIFHGLGDCSDSLKVVERAASNKLKIKIKDLKDMTPDQLKQIHAVIHGNNQ